MNLTFEADLHNHTTFSDGELTPKQLVQTAKSIGLRAVAITDHDTIDGLPEGLIEARKIGIDFICGVEITIRFSEPFFSGSVHLLAYFPSSLLEKGSFIQQTSQTLSLCRGKHLLEKRLRALNDHFGPSGKEPTLPRELTCQDVNPHGGKVSRRNLVYALMDMGIKDKELMNHMVGNQSPVYIPAGVTLNLLKHWLFSWPFVTILAHPAAGSHPGKTHYKEILPPFEIIKRLLPQFDDINLDGLEIYYPGHTEFYIEELKKLSTYKNYAIATGGSDCHDSKLRPIGTAGVPYSVCTTLNQLMVEKLASV